MLIVFIRTAIIFVTLLIIMRLMGKRQIGEMQPFEFIITLIIADLACIPMSDVSIPLLYGIAAILALFILHQSLSLLEGAGIFMKRAISGKPSLVINKDGIDFKELKRNSIDVDDLTESMRSLGYFSFDDISYAIFESNGKLSAVANKERENAEKTLPLLLINEGKKNTKNMSLVKITDSELEDYLKKHGVEKIKKVGVMTLDNKGRVYLQKMGEKFKILEMPLKEGVEW